jgi:predicted lipid-binding transport protein (Tim44 family)
MTARPTYQDDASVASRSGPVLLNHRDSWLGVEAGVRSQPGWSPKPEPRRISRSTWKRSLGGMFMAGLTLGYLLGRLMGLEIGRRRPVRTMDPDREDGQTRAARPASASFKCDEQ